MACPHVATRLLCTLPLLLTAAWGARSAGSPAGKVISLLRDMQKKVNDEGEKEQELYDKYMCYCKSNLDALTESVNAANSKIAPMKGDISMMESSREILMKEVEDDKQAQEEAKEGEMQARTIRDKESAENKAKAQELLDAVRAVERAIQIIKEGAASFLQQGTAEDAEKIRAVVQEVNLEEPRRSQVLAFLEGAEGYQPSSGMALGTLQTIMEFMEKDHQASIDGERAAVVAHEELMRSKMAERNSLTEQLQAKEARLGETKLRLVELRKELDKGSEQREEDKVFLTDLKKSCQAKTQEWTERVALRNDELEVLSETIKMLDDDENRDLLKSTLGGDQRGLSLLQLPPAPRQGAAAALAKAKEQLATASRPGVEFISLALKGKKVGLDEVLEMINKLMKTLEKEQSNEEEKKSYCKKQYKELEDKQAKLANQQLELGAQSKEIQESIEAIKLEMKQMEAGIKELDKSVSDATALRKAEYKDFRDFQMQALDAKDLLDRAGDRLRRFYERDHSDGGLLLAEVSAHFKQRRGAPEKPPKADFSSQPVGGESSKGVLGLLEQLVKDVESEADEAKKADDNSQKAYDEFMKDSGDKRSEDSSALALKGGEKASREAELRSRLDSKASGEDQKRANDELKLALDSECVWLIENFDARVDAREGELQALQEVKSTLKASSSDDSSPWSLVQLGTVEAREHSRHLRGQV